MATTSIRGSGQARPVHTPFSVYIGAGLLTLYAAAALYLAANFGPMLADQPALPVVRGVLVAVAVLAIVVVAFALRLTPVTYRWVHGLLWVLMPLSFYLFLNLRVEAYSPGGGLVIGALGLSGLLLSRPLVAGLRHADVMQRLCPQRVVAWQAALRKERNLPAPGGGGDVAPPSDVRPAGFWLRLLVWPPYGDVPADGAPLAEREGEPRHRGETGSSQRDRMLPDTLQPQGSRGHEWLESIAIALIMALIIRTFALEAFKIPTGSMKPTLNGDTYIQVVEPGSTRQARQLVNTGDKILVNKFAYLFDDPQRWDIIVFKYPLNTKRNFIKRLVGLPNEEVLFFGGDIWTRPLDPNGEPLERAEWTLQRKPRDVQESMWVLAYTTYHASPEAQATVPPTARSQPNWLAHIQPLAIGMNRQSRHLDRGMRNADWVHIGGDPARTDAMNWPVLDGDRVWWPSPAQPTGWRVNEAQDGFVAEPRGDEWESIGFVPMITDRFALPRSQREFLTYDQDSDRLQLMGQRTAPQRVGDIRVMAHAEFAAADSRLRVTLHRDLETLIVELGGDGSASVRVRNVETGAVQQPELDVAARIAEFGRRMEPGKPVHIEVGNADRVARLYLDGVPVLEWAYLPQGEIPQPGGSYGGNAGANGVTALSLGAAGGPVALTDVQVYRDVHYVPDGIANELDPRIAVHGDNFFVLGDNTTNSKDSRLWYVLALTVETADGERYEVYAEPDPAPDTQSSQTPFLNPPQAVSFRPATIDPANLQRRLQAMWISDHGGGLGRIEMSHPDVNRDEWRDRLAQRMDAGAFERLAQRYRLEPSESYAMADGRYAVPMVAIEDISGVVHRVPVDALQAVRIFDAPLVPREHLIGRALMRFWPDNLGFIR